MANNQFKPFATAAGANVTPQSDWENLPALFSGFTSGKASSAQINKSVRQASVIASVVAQFIADTNDADVLDDGNTAALQQLLLLAIQKAATSNIPAASTTQAGIVKLSSATASDDETLAATPRAVHSAMQNADGRLAKDQNGADIPNKNQFMTNIGAVSLSTQQTVGGMKTFSETPRITRSNFPGVVMTCTNVSEGTVGREVSMLSDLGNVVFIARKGDGTDSEQRMVRVPMSASGTALVSGSNAVADSRGYYKTPNSTEVTPITASEIAGLPQLFPGAVAPTGWLKCNGQTFDKILYPVLASRYPSGVLPDLRGEFVRGWDDGRGVDAGRALLSAQGDAIRNITGSVFYGYDADGGAVTGYDSGALRYGTAIVNDTQRGYTWTQDAGAARWYSTTLDASRVVPTANENRPRNIAFNYIVRAA
ncbi:phage tail protein [Pectobacterium jejuense]|uniref:phage tail protein n=1 Tax=Pectobacterium jejuense TaxID=2974022 RepID=UPI003809D198